MPELERQQGKPMSSQNHIGWAPFVFWPSHAVNLEVMCRVCRLELPALESTLRADDDELHLSAHVFSHGVRMAEVEISTHNPVAHDAGREALLRVRSRERPKIPAGIKPRV